MSYTNSQINKHNTGNQEKQCNEYTYARFPDKEYGEWFGYFHYDGTLSQPAKGNMYKGPFHIPRMLLKCHLLCKEIQGYDKQ
jgi:N-acylglucosamine 2-epimerase